MLAKKRGKRKLQRKFEDYASSDLLSDDVESSALL